MAVPMRLVIFGLVTLCNAALAGHDDYEMAKRLQKSGDIVAVERVLQQVSQINPGRVIEIDLFEEDGRYLYEIEVVDAKGEVKVFYFDARSGEQAKGKFKHH